GSVSSTNGAATSFDPAVMFGGGNGTVYSVSIDTGGVLYVGGYFNNAKGTTRNYAAAFSTSGSGSLKPWDPNPNSIVYTVLADYNKIYLGGAFNQLNGGTARNFLASVNNTTGSVTSFDPNMNGQVRCMALSG